MSFTPPIYSTRAYVRGLLGNMGVQNIKDETIDEAIKNASRIADVESNRSGRFWETTESEFGVISQATALMASVLCSASVQNQENNRRLNWDLAIGMCHKVAASDVTIDENEGYGVFSTGDFPSELTPNDVLYFDRFGKPITRGPITQEEQATNYNAF